MRRIKSAPANIASMSNNKKSDKKIARSILNKKEYLLYNLDNNSKKNNIISLNNYKKKRELKNNFMNIGDYLSDITNDIDTIPTEESTIISAIILYVSHNILKREKLKEFNNFILKIILKYIIIYCFHVYVLKDETHYLIHISDIINLYLPPYNPLNNIVTIIDNNKLIDGPSINKLAKSYNNIHE